MKILSLSFSIPYQINLVPFYTLDLQRIASCIRHGMSVLSSLWFRALRFFKSRCFGNLEIWTVRGRDPIYLYYTEIKITNVSFTNSINGIWIIFQYIFYIDNFIQFSKYVVFQKTGEQYPNIYDIPYYNTIKKYLRFLGLDPHQKYGLIIVIIMVISMTSGLVPMVR